MLVTTKNFHVGLAIKDNGKLVAQGDEKTKQTDQNAQRKKLEEQWVRCNFDKTEGGG
ncbi:MAG: hypothetical protein LUE65_07460 [Clostridiales bacterium]|nr:hypothetical protein [Clostridiales bacterium]